MTLEIFSYIATIAEAVFVVISVIFIWYEVRQNTKMTKSANTQAFFGLVSPVNLQLAQDRQLAQLWLEGATDFDKLDKIDKERYRYLLFNALTFHENIFYQSETGLIDSDIHGSWDRSLAAFVSQHKLGALWEDIKGFYHPKFSEHVDGIINNVSQQTSNGEKS